MQSVIPLIFYEIHIIYLDASIHIYCMHYQFVYPFDSVDCVMVNSMYGYQYLTNYLKLQQINLNEIVFVWHKPTNTCIWYMDGFWFYDLVTTKQ